MSNPRAPHVQVFTTLCSISTFAALSFTISLLVVPESVRHTPPLCRLLPKPGHAQQRLPVYCNSSIASMGRVHPSKQDHMLCALMTSDASEFVWKPREAWSGLLWYRWITLSTPLHGKRKGYLDWTGR